MERDFNSDEFEQFLQNKTEQYKIYPSERSWKKIYNTLHPGRSWFRIGGSLLLLTGFFLASHKLFFNNTEKKEIKTQVSQSSSSTRTTSTRNTVKVKSGTVVPDVNLPGTQPVVSGPIKGHLNVNAYTDLPAAPKQARTINAHSQTNKLLASGRMINTEEALSQLNVRDDNSDDTPSSSVEAEDLSVESQPLQSNESPSSKEVIPTRLTQPGRNKLGLQFYFSPTISYRRLADNKYGNSTLRNIPLATNHLNIDRFVDHNPSIGAEFGSNILWKVGRNITIKSGMQLNYSRYSIKAYKFYFEKASIALNPVGRNADTLTSYTSFRNFSGYSPEILQNQYLQVSVPLGAEVKVFGNKRLQLNVAGTIQPSYLLFNETYLLSTDYVNYAKEPSLVQKWNIHTSFETFISYKVGGVRWQVGPQFRYQMLSTYNDRYPIKEYLMEYGVKVGVSKTLK